MDVGLLLSGQKRAFCVRAVGHHHYRAVETALEENHTRFREFGSQFQLRTKRPGGTTDVLQHLQVFLSGRHQSTQRQSDASPQRMTDQPADRDRLMTIQPFRTRQSGRGVVMNPGQLDLRTVPFCRRIVDRPFDVRTDVTDGDLPDGQKHRLRGRRTSAAPERLKKVMVILPVFRVDDGPQPAGHGFSSTAAHHDHRQVISAPSVQTGTEQTGPLCYPLRQRPCSHRGFFSSRNCSWKNNSDPGTWWLCRPLLPPASPATPGYLFRPLRPPNALMKCPKVQSFESGITLLIL